MTKKKGNAGSKKASAATKAKRSAAKAQKTRAAKGAAALKAVLPLMDETAPKDILDGILKVQQQQMKLAGLLQGSGGISVSIGKPGEGNSDEDYRGAHQGRCAGASP